MDDDMDRTTPLERLAAAHGVATTVPGADGELVDVSEGTLIAVLGALGVPATTADQIAFSLAEAEAEPWRSMLPPCTVVRSSVGAQVPVHVTDGDEVEVHVELEGDEGVVELEQSDVWVEPRQVGSRRVGRATFTVPDGLPLGYHVAVARSGGVEVEAPLIVVPDRLDVPPDDVIVRALAVAVASLRSQSSWGVGDLGDLVDVAWTAARNDGADVVLVDPLQQANPQVPGSLLTNRWVDPVYLRVEDIRETGYLSSADRSLVEWSAEEARDAGADAGPVDLDAVRTAKRAALDVVHQVPRSPARQARYEEFVESGGQALENFATWSALVDHHGGLDLPQAVMSSRSPGVHAARARLADRVELHRWIQWVADEQRADTHRRAQEAGALLGVGQTVVAGSALDGPDAWASSTLVARGAAVGSAPGAEDAAGSVRHEIAWNPRELARAGFAPFRDAVRAAARHASMIVVDDAGALFRSWWVPGGARASAGTYVAQDSEALTGILALEAHRAGVYVVVDDSRLADATEQQGLADRGFVGLDDLRRPPFRGVRPGVVARVTSRLDAPLAAWLAGEDIDLQDSLGILDDADSARRVRRSERDQVLARALRAGTTSPDAAEREQVEGLYAWATRSGAAMVVVRLADAVGDRRVPAVRAAGSDYPSGRLPLVDANGALVRVEDLPQSARLRALFDHVRPDA
ncbi:4-alpha-glucanotransferase [Paraoerskovia marina]|nr:4-alpha-glucanotransferase [Paraoerskovia marina]